MISIFETRLIIQYNKLWIIIVFSIIINTANEMSTIIRAGWYINIREIYFYYYKIYEKIKCSLGKKKDQGCHKKKKNSASDLIN